MRAGYSLRFLYNNRGVGLKTDHLVYILISAQFIESLWVLIYKYLGIQSFNHRGWKKKFWKWFKGDFKGAGCICVNTWIYLIGGPYMWDTGWGFPLPSGEHTFTCLLKDQNAVHPLSFISALLRDCLDWETESQRENILGFRASQAESLMMDSWKDSGCRSWSPAACLPWSLSQLLMCCANMNFTHLFYKGRILDNLEFIANFSKQPWSFMGVVQHWGPGCPVTILKQIL